VGIYGLSAALDYIAKEGIDRIRNKRKEIFSYLLTRMKEIDEAIIYSNQDLARQIGVLSFNIQNIPCSQVTYELDRNDIAVRMGFHCAPQAHSFLGSNELGGTVRMSPSSFTSFDEIDNTIKILKEITYGSKR